MNSNNQSPHRILQFGFVLLAICLISSGSQATQILIKAEATHHYTRSQANKNKNDPTSYHFVKGFFSAGNINDKSLVKVDFMDIAQNLAVHLTKQNYIPSKDTENNDVMVVVNWGITAVEDDLMDIWSINSQEEYEEIYGLVGEAVGEQADELRELFGPTPIAAWGEADRRKNSNMLGFSESLDNSNVMTQDKYELESALNRERYFLVVMAYDYQKYIKEKEMDLLWITRFSMKATGTTFDSAYQELTFAASDYFGKNMKGLSKKRTDDKSKVEIGDIEVLETVEDQ
ncbi:MAG: hypothetical protein O7C75_01665 [Verrucomicrobia bacterium]|nr:hypothetical protein [Verrucomicrobiota bacterium]